MKIGTILGFVTLCLIEYGSGQQGFVRGTGRGQRNQRRTPKLIGFIVPQSDGTTKFQLLSDAQQNIQVDQGTRSESPRRRNNGQIGKSISPDRTTVFGNGRRSQRQNSNRNVGRRGSFRNGPPVVVIHPSLMNRGKANLNRESFITQANNRRQDITASSSIIPDVSRVSRVRPKAVFTKHIPQLHRLAEGQLLEKPKIQKNIITKAQMNGDDKLVTRIGALTESTVLSSTDSPSTIGVKQKQDTAVIDNSHVDNSVIAMHSPAVDGVIVDSGRTSTELALQPPETVLRSTIQKKEPLISNLTKNGNHNSPIFSFAPETASSSEVVSPIVAPPLSEVHTKSVEVSGFKTEPAITVSEETGGSLVDIPVASKVDVNDGVIAKPAETPTTYKPIVMAQTEKLSAILASGSREKTSNKKGEQKGILDQGQRIDTGIAKSSVVTSQQSNIQDSTTAVNADIKQVNVETTAFSPVEETTVSATLTPGISIQVVSKDEGAKRIDGSIKTSKQITSSQGGNDINPFKNEKDVIISDIVSLSSPPEPTHQPQYQQNEQINTITQAKSGKSSQIVLPSDVGLSENPARNVIEKVTLNVIATQDDNQANSVLTTKDIPLQNNITRSQKEHHVADKRNADGRTVLEGQFVTQSGLQNILAQLALRPPTRPQQPILQNMPFQHQPFNPATQFLDPRFVQQSVLQAQRAGMHIPTHNGRFLQTFNGQVISVLPQTLFAQPFAGGQQRAAGAQQMVIGPNGQVFALVPQFPQAIAPQNLLQSIKQLIAADKASVSKKPNGIQKQTTKTTVQASRIPVSHSQNIVSPTSIEKSSVTLTANEPKVVNGPILSEIHDSPVVVEQKVPATDVPLVGDHPLAVPTDTSSVPSTITVPRTIPVSETTIGSLQTAAASSAGNANTNADGGSISLVQIRTLLASLIKEMMGTSGNKAKTGSSAPIKKKSPSTVNTVSAVNETGTTSIFTTQSVNVTEALNVTSEATTTVVTTTGTTINPELEPGEGPPTTTMDPEVAEAAAEAAEAAAA